MPANSTMPRLEAPPTAPALAEAKAQPDRGNPSRIQVAEVEESHPADRAFHAALARLSGGISPLWLREDRNGRFEDITAGPRRTNLIS